MMISIRKRTVFVPLMLIWITAAVFAGGQPDLEIAVPPAFLEQRGEEWVEEFRAQLVQELAATPVATGAVHLVLQFAFVPDLPVDPGEAAGRLTQAIQFADERLRRGVAPAAVTAAAKRNVESGDRAVSVGRSYAETALRRVEQILEDVRDVGMPASVPGDISGNIETGAPPGDSETDTPVEIPDGGRPDR